MRDLRTGGGRVALPPINRGGSAPSIGHQIVHLGSVAVHPLVALAHFAASQNRAQIAYERRRNLARNLTHPPGRPDSEGLPYTLSTYIARQQERARRRPH